jgi:hypothetical protein
MDNDNRDDVRYGIDNNPHGDAEKGATVGGIGGAVTGGVAGSAAGPVGTIIGAVVGGVVGAVASGAAVAAVDRVDDDTTVTGIGDNPNWDKHENEWRTHYTSNYASTNTPYDNNYQHAYRFGHDLGTHPDYQGRSWDSVQTDAQRDWERSNPGTWSTYQQPIQYSWERSSTMVGTGGTGSTGMGGTAYADNPPGIQTGGLNDDGSRDTRGITEKVSDAVTGDRIDDKTGKPI